MSDVPAKPDWFAIKREYETSTTSQRDLAEKHQVPASTLMKRAMREKWKQGSKLVRAAVRDVEARAGELAQERVANDLAPWIAQMRSEITKRGYRLGERGIERIERMFETLEPDDGKTEANVANAAERYLRLARTSLGMNDGGGVGGAVNLSILTNQAAVQVVASSAS